VILDTVIYGEITLFNLFQVLFILIIAAILAKVVVLNIRRSLKDKLRKDHLEILVKAVYYTIIGVAVISVLPILGVNPSGFLVAGGIAGLVIGFASQKIVANLISGVFLVVERPVKIGDQINIGDVSGIVVDIHIISTIIRTFDGLYVRVPNEKVFTSSITNFVGNVARRFEYEVGISYSDDVDKASEVIIKVIEEHPFALKNPAPQVFVDRLGESAVVLRVRMWAPSTEWFGVRMELLWKIKKALEEEGIKVPFPQRVVWFGDEPSR
jgi:small-conductance mechanosensitive channel